MKKQLLLTLFSVFFLTSTLSAQTTGTYVVADNPAHVASCVDSVITLAKIIEIAGIRDLNDPNDNPGMYKMFRLAGSVITTDELTSVRYSDYPAVFIQKTNATNFHNSGIQIFTRVITPPTRLFTVDTLTYTVEKNATVNFTPDFFSKFEFFNSGKDLTNLYDRILFTDQSVGTETSIGTNNTWSIVGKGKYKIRVQVAVCNPTDYYYDSIYVIVKETPCLKVEIKNMPSVCRDEVIDIKPYVYVDGHVATATDFNALTFTNKSDASNTAGTVFNPDAMDMKTMVDKLTKTPRIQIAYQPNVDLGVCTNYMYMPATKVPTKLLSTDYVITQNNHGSQTIYSVEGDYYSFNNMFSKNVIKKLYLDNFDVHANTTFDYYTDDTYQNRVEGDNLTPDIYHIVATNPACDNDTTKFTIHVKERDFEIVWQNITAQGKGFYTFTAPVQAGATYAWFIWGGSIISGNNTNQVNVYYSETAASSVLVSCTITLAIARIAGENAPQKSAVYLTSNANDEKVTIPNTTTTTSVLSGVAKSTLTAYPNPAAETFALSGAGIYDIKIYNAVGQLVFANKSYEAATPISIENKGLLVVYASQNGVSRVVKVIRE